MEDVAQGASFDTAPAVSDGSTFTPDPGGSLSGQEVPAVGGGEAPQETSAEPEFQFELPSGSKYRSLEDLTRGATEKDFTIERLKAEMASLRANVQQVPQAPQVDEAAVRSQQLESLTLDIAREIQADPMFADANPADIKAEARIQARNRIWQQELIQKQFEQKQQEAQRQQQMVESRQFVDQHWNDLNSEVGVRVFEDAKASGRPFVSPQDHLNAIHAEYYRMSRGGGVPAPQAGGVAGVQGAIQNPQRPMFGYPNGTGQPQGQGALSPGVQRAIEVARQNGHTSPEAIQRITERAIENEKRFGRR